MRIRVSQHPHIVGAVLLVVWCSIIVLAFLSNNAMAAGQAARTIHISWTPLTRNENGSPLELKRLKVYIYRGERRPDCKAITNMKDRKVIMGTAKAIPIETN
jgi:hypothetical protein